MTPNNISVCVLTYGDHIDLTMRCLESLRKCGSDAIADYCIGTNAVSPRVHAYVDNWAYQTSRQYGKPVTLLDAPFNRFKYPLMRRMLRRSNPALASYVMWFDDDSYISFPAAFWLAVDKALSCSPDMLGQFWERPMSDDQRRWICSKPEWHCDTTAPGYFESHRFRFCQGAWWVASSKMLLDLDWPIPELRHCGGDSLLGEVMRLRGYKPQTFDLFVQINADEHGEHSKAKRRGFNEPTLAWRWNDQPLPTDHQNIDVEWTYYRKELATISREEHKSNEENRSAVCEAG